MTLGEKQRLFTQLIAKLIEYIYLSGYEATLGDAWAKDGHKDGSNHYIRLAIDLNLFKDGVWLEETADHKQIGEAWESMHPLCRWGGRFDDGNHYSFYHNGHM